MATVNNKYVTALKIMNMVSRVHKQKASQYNIGQFVEWCAECEVNYIGDTEGFMLYKAEEIKVDEDNLRALQPCNVYRTLDVCSDEDMETRIPFYNNGTYYIFDDDQTFNTNDNDDYVVYVSYYGIALDPETGYPLIKKGHEQACEAFCITKIYEEDYLLGNIDANRWQYFQNKLEIELRSADSSFRHMSRNELEDFSKIVGNMIPEIGYMPTSKLD